MERYLCCVLVYFESVKISCLYGKPCLYLFLRLRVSLPIATALVPSVVVEADTVAEEERLYFGSPVGRKEEQLVTAMVETDCVMSIRLYCFLWHYIIR